MRKADIFGCCGLSLMAGIFAGTIISHEVSHYNGRIQERYEARQEAREWAKKELMKHCVSWYTDRRNNDYMACLKPEWMR